MKNRVYELDGLRAIAIFLVFGVHYIGFSRLMWKLPTYGWIGVDIFFALSGYLITRILLGLRGKQGAYKTFYSRRMIRIAPPYLVATAVMLGLIYFVPHTISPGKYLLRQLLFLQAFYPKDLHFIKTLLTHPRQHLLHTPKLLPRLPTPQPGLTPAFSSAVIVYWSLSVEEYFYLLWAPIVLHFKKRAVVLIGLAICAVSAWIRLQYGESSAYESVFTRLDAPIYGAFLALMLDSRSIREKAKASRALKVAGAASILAIAGIIAALRPTPGADIRESPLFLSLGLSLLSVAATSIVGLLVLRSDSRWWLSRLLRTKPFQFVGTISYSMYLFHMIVALLVSQAFTATADRSLELLQAFLCVALTVGAAWLSWHFIEKPLLCWKDRMFPAVKVTEPALN
jgi:peptidoglycan/LPS O-acetylase OafA/YrhL